MKNAPSGPSLGTINVIFVAPERTGSYPSKVMSMVRLPANEDGLEPKKARILTQPTLGFSDEDKVLKERLSFPKVRLGYPYKPIQK